MRDKEFKKAEKEWKEENKKTDKFSVYRHFTRRILRLGSDASRYPLAKENLLEKRVEIITRDLAMLIKGDNPIAKNALEGIKGRLLSITEEHAKGGTVSATELIADDCTRKELGKFIEIVFPKA